jgi:hypothetical protein
MSIQDPSRLDSMDLYAVAWQEAMLGFDHAWDARCSNIAQFKFTLAP